MILKVSPFLHILSMDNEYMALYNSLNLEIAFVKKLLIEKYRRGDNFVSTDQESEMILRSLLKINLLIPEDSDGFELYNSYTKALQKPAINILYLLLTDACNLRCGYCYFLADMYKDYNFSFMSEEIMVAAIEMFARCIKKSIADGSDDQQIVIYGGEPTLNKKTLLTTLKYIDSAKERGILPSYVSVTINTNGILLDEEILEQSRKSGAVVAISIDGPQEIHDQKRISSLGKGSFENVIKAYNLAKSIGAKTGVCVTVDKHNLSQLQKVIYWMADSLDTKGMGFNILIESGKIETEVEYQRYSQIAAEQLIECFKIAREKGIYEDRMMRRVKCFVEKEPVLSDCGGCGLQVVVSPDGRIGVCQAFCGSKEYFVSEPFETFEPENHPFWKEWRSRSPFSIPKCKSCIAFGNCGGGCPYSAYKRQGTIWALDERFCIHAKASVEFLIKDLWQKQKGDE